MRALSGLDLGIYTFDYMYSFFQNEKWEIAGGLGIYWVDFAFSIQASVDINGNPVAGGPRYQSTDFSGPLPYLSLSFEYYITPKWLAIIKGGYFQLNVADIDGKLITLGANLEYQFTKRFGLGGGYNGFKIETDTDDGNLNTNLEYKYHGLQVYALLRF